MLAYLVVLALVAASSPPPPPPAAVAQWDFDGSLASTTGAPALVLASSFRGGRPDGAFETVDLGGAAASVLTVRPGTTLRLRHGLLANGGGTLLNAYTLIADLRVLPKSRKGFVAVLQTHGLNVNQAEWGLDATRGVGGLGVFGGAVVWDRWYRLAVVVDPARGTATSYLDGAPVATRTGLVVDGRDALEAEALLFADDDFEVGTVQLNSLRLVDAALPAEAVAALGGPRAGGLPVPAAPTLAVRAPGEGVTWTAGTLVAVAWQAEPPHGEVALTLLRGGAVVRELAVVATKRGRFAWRVAHDLPAGDDYALRLAWSGAGGPVVAESRPFAVVGGGPAPRATELVSNGRFEATLAPWVAVVGHPELAAGNSGDGGRSYLRGRAGDFVVRQDVELAARGVDAAAVARGLVCEGAVRLRTQEKAGRFDDQTWLRVAFLDGEGRELGAARTLAATGPEWGERRAEARVPEQTRTLRVEVAGRLRRGKRNDAVADDVRISVRADGPREAIAVTKRPLLYGPGGDGVTVLWETSLAAAQHRVVWREVGGEWREGGPVETQRINDGHAVQRARLGPLRAGARYEYRVESDDEVEGPFGFGGPPEAGATHRVAWVSDNQDGYPVFREVVRQVAAAAPSLVISAGDLVQHSMFLREWQQQWFGPLSEADLGQTTPVVFARGNHDGERELAYAYSALPGNEAWYAFTFGRVRYVVLDTEAQPGVAAEQTSWLAAELKSEAARDADFRVVVMHKPAFASLWDGAAYDGQAWVREHWVPLFERFGVDLVVAGHAHGYMRYVRGEQTYLVIGGAGGLLDTAVSAPWEAAKVVSAHHHVMMEAAPGRLGFEVRAVGGALLDAFELRRHAVTPTVSEERPGASRPAP